MYQSSRGFSAIAELLVIHSSSASAIRANEECFTCSKSTTGFPASKNESHSLPLSPLKGVSKTPFRCFTNKTYDILLIKPQSLFVLKLLDKAFMLPLISHRMAQIAILGFCNEAGR